MRLFTIAAAAAALSVSACKSRPAEPEVTVENAWVQLPVIPGRPGAAYFTLVSNNDPTKLTGVVGIGKQLLMTREALTTFSIANDVAKYFAILPAILALKGVQYRPMPAASQLPRNLAIYGAGGVIAPFIGIKLIDIAVAGLSLA